MCLRCFQHISSQEVDVTLYTITNTAVLHPPNQTGIVADAHTLFLFYFYFFLYNLQTDCASRKHATRVH